MVHAISTHRVTLDMDFFTAMDDLQESEGTGVGMMRFVGFDSACFYRYARIDWPQLVQALGGDEDLALRTVEAFLRVSLAAPCPRANSTALPPATPRASPSPWCVATVWGGPWLAPSSDPFALSGRVGWRLPLSAALDRYWGRLPELYGTQSLLSTAVLPPEPDLPLDRLDDAAVGNVDECMAAVTKALSVDDVTP